MSLRAKLLLPLLLSSILAGIYFWGYWMPQTLARNEEAQLEVVDRHLNSIAVGLAPLLLSNKIDTVAGNLDELLKENPDWVAVRLLNSQGRQVYPLLISHAPPSIIESMNVRTIKKRIAYLGSDLGELTVQFDVTPSLAGVRHEYRELAVILVGGFALVLITVVVTLEVAVRRPAVRLSEASRRLAQGDFGSSLPAAGNDEIGMLVESFSTMRDEISKHQAEMLHEIIERTQAQEALKESEKGLNAAQRIAHLGSWELDLKTNELQWSDEIFRIFEIDPKKFGASYQAFLDAIHPEDREKVNQTYTDSLQDKSPYEITHRLAMADGRIKFVQERGETEYADNGEPLRSIGTVQDITERKLAEDSLRKSEERFRTVADYTYDWEYWQGPDGEILYMTPSCERITGYAQAEFVADPVLLNRIIYPDDAHLMAQHLHSIKFEDEATVDFRVVHRDGGIRWIAHGCRAVYGSDGHFMGRRASNRDITERKQAEQALQMAEARFRLAFDSAAIGMALVSMDGRFIQVNQALCWLVGYRQDELLQMTFQEITYPEDLSADLANAQHLLDGEQISYQLEKRYIHKDGHLVWTQLTASVFMDEQSGQPHFIKQIQDISERKAAAEALRKLNDTLDQRVKEEVGKNMEQERLMIQQSRLAAMGEMIGNIAHQWRQPLNALGLLLANIKDANDFGELDTPYLDESVTKGRQLIEKMSTTIDDFRNFFKPNKVKENFSLEKSALDALSLLGQSLQNHNIQVRGGSDPGALAYGYPNEFSQVLLNVLNNAKDAILEKKIAQGVIEIALGHDTQNVWIVIRDNAGGIPDAVLPKIFDPYFSTKEKGTGIGLYMSKIIIKDHMNGNIEVRNLDGGAEFTISCPAADASLPPAT